MLTVHSYRTSIYISTNSAETGMNIAEYDKSIVSSQLDHLIEGDMEKGGDIANRSGYLHTRNTGTRLHCK